MNSELDEVQRRLKAARHEQALAELTCESLEKNPPRHHPAPQQALLHARVELDAAERVVSDLELAERRLLDGQAARDLQLGEAMARLTAEDRAFWVRRFHTSLAIAHGAAFVALASHMFDGSAEQLGVIANATFIPMVTFSLGMVIAGAIPFAMYRGRTTMAERLALGSAGLFVLGVAFALAGVFLAADLAVPL